MSTTTTGATRRVGPGRYVIDGQRVPSVTTVLESLAKPGLQFWAAREVATYAVDNLDRWADMPREDAVDWLKGTPQRVSTRAAGKGTDIHRHAEALIHGHADDVPLHLRPYVEACARWLDRWEVSPALVETAVYHRTLGYAGEADLFGLSNRHDEPILVDYKTGKGVWPEAALQIAAYRYAEFRIDDGGVPRLLPEVGGCYVVHLQPGSWEAVPVDAGEFTFQVFTHLLAVHKAWANADALLDHGIREETDDVLA